MELNVLSRSELDLVAGGDLSQYEECLVYADEATGMGWDSWNFANPADPNQQPDYENEQLAYNLAMQQWQNYANCQAGMSEQLIHDMNVEFQAQQQQQFQQRLNEGTDEHALQYPPGLQQDMNNFMNNQVLPTTDNFLPDSLDSWDSTYASIMSIAADWSSGGC